MISIVVLSKKVQTNQPASSALQGGENEPQQEQSKNFNKI